MDQDFEDMDSEGRWQNLYIEIRNQSHECPLKVAKYPENRNRNRYRDVSPFDHSRVKLENTENDYINASLVVMEEAQRSYILTQGPLRNTCGHFWLMIWEQNTKAVIMLNRVIEKGSEKCAQYWPTQDEHEMPFRDTHFLITLISEDVKSYYTTRVLELQNDKTGEKREIYHFHYTTWPDFGVPESPASFLNFLFKVRESGSLGADHGPAVVHCSAGIGRSGTLSLVDTCLVLMDKRKDPSSVDIKAVLLDMRKYRMGLIQTPDQLRFSYRAVLEGAKYIMGDCSVQKMWRELSKEDQDPVSDSESLLPTQPPSKCPLEKYNGSRVSRGEDGGEGELGERTTGTESPNKEQDVDESTANARKRPRDERVSNWTPKITDPKQTKPSITDSEKKRKRPRTSDR
ncbi:tyrosine-protein phosphatase non-receptor type 2 isoform X2 [Salvelinus fontinalis]|uniref:tyrosine-protein phosphatase non-receptor type 2 isoform X2 n=1 Tax=Salvelinus fontinalis TaxID=8038 RepID=UPI0024868007|nr:tyrosine-protein phosphatase non-receptor type 2 isoform X2 [Salvelinus fontinalis]